MMSQKQSPENKPKVKPLNAVELNQALYYDTLTPDQLVATMKRYAHNDRRVYRDLGNIDRGITRLMSDLEPEHLASLMVSTIRLKDMPVLADQAGVENIENNLRTAARLLNVEVAGIQLRFKRD